MTGWREANLFVLQNHMSNRLLLGVGKREMCTLAAEPLGELCRLAAEFQNRPLPGHAKHLNILPGNTVAQAGTNGFHSGLFGGKAGGQALRGIGFAHAIADLSGGEDAPEKTLTKTLHGGLDPPHFGDVNSSPYYHLRPHAKVSYRLVAAF
jgi:hypothetical protein